jgi:hypothetical protein
VLATSLGEEVATVVELADLYHGRWRIQKAFKRLKLLNRTVPMTQPEPGGAQWQVNRSAACKLPSRCIGPVLWLAGGFARGVYDWVTTLSRRWTRRIAGRYRPRNPAHSKPHPSMAYKRAA